MTTKYYRCTLLTDVVLNTSLATEGNMQSLDYIPGSNFLGIVATKYTDFGADAYDVFHSGKVSFGDALIANGNAVSYPIPFSLFLDKLKKDITKDSVWVHHGIKPTSGKEGIKLQLKQNRTGYINGKKEYFAGIEKEFSLKSAYDADERRSKDSAMFGFEALKKGQQFIFSIIYKDKKYIARVEEQLLGNKFIGKSKTAQYGSVKIETLNDVTVIEDRPNKNNYIVIYAESNLCFVNEHKQTTFQPEASDFGITGGTINWEKSQIRTYSYSPWNNKRNTAATQRDVILKGSVIVIDITNKADIESLPKQMGEYNAEGLGRVIYNPEFIDYRENGIWEWEGKLKHLQEDNKDNQGRFTEIEISKVKTPLAKILAKKNNTVLKEKNISDKVINEMRSDNAKKLRTNKITKTQWGAIREKATHVKDIDQLIKQLFEPGTGYLTHGVAAERIWDKQRGAKRDTLKSIIENNKDLGTIFVAKFAAEMAKNVNR